MKIFALVSDGFGGRGGIAKFNRDLLSALCAMSQVERVVALARLMPDEPGELPAKLDYVTGAVGSKLRYAIAVLRAARRIPRRCVIICGHINLLPFAFLARAISRRRSSEVSDSGGQPRSRPVVLIVHGIDAWQPTRRQLANRLAARIDALVSVSDFTRQRFLAWARPSNAQTFLLPNCVDLSRFTPGPKNPALLERYGLRDRTVLLTVGRLSASERSKGVDEVLEVLPELAQEVPELAYLIVGEGCDRPRLEQKARRLGVGARVKFTGWLNDSELVEHYRLADAFVMPGRGEGFGIVYLEALACGVPVVASTADASAEVVHGCDMAVVADPGEGASVRAAIRTALRLPRGRPARLAHRCSTAAFHRRCADIFETLGADFGILAGSVAQTGQAVPVVSPTRQP